MLMAFRSAAAGAALAFVLALTGRSFEAAVVLLSAVAAGALLDYVVRTERRKGPRAKSYTLHF